MMAHNVVTHSNHITSSIMCVALKVICAGVGLGLGPRLVPRCLDCHNCYKATFLVSTLRNFNHECELCTYFLPLGKIGSRTG